MSLCITCSSCSKQLRVPEHARGMRVKCPACTHTFLVEDEAEAIPEVLEVEDRIVERPAPPTRRPRVTEDPEEPVRRNRPRDDEADDHVIEEVKEEVPPPRLKTKKRKKLRTLALPDEREKLVWPWWVFGGGGICLLMFALLCTAIFARSDALAKYLALYLLIMLPISTVIFFVAMYLSSVLVGAMEIGEIHVALIKGFGLIFIVNLVSLMPFGGYLALGVWLVGLMILFRLDLWETRMLVFINWVLNFGVRFFLLVAIVGGASRAGRHERNFDRFDRGRQVQGDVWDDIDARERGGQIEYDPAKPEDEEVIGITFREAPIRDADLVYMKDFPRLIKLDFTGTPITDTGLAHLKSCKGLQRLVLTRTRVTDAGVQELQQALPLVRILR